MISLSAASTTEPLTHLTPDDEFEVLWARTVLQRALDSLQEEYRRSGRLNLFQVLQDQLDGQRPQSGRDLADELGMSEGAVRVSIHRMRQRLGDLIRAEVAETVPDNTDVDEELQRLQQSLEKSS